MSSNLFDGLSLNEDADLPIAPSKTFGEDDLDEIDDEVEVDVDVDVKVEGEMEMENKSEAMEGVTRNETGGFNPNVGEVTELVRKDSDVTTVHSNGTKHREELNQEHDENQDEEDVVVVDDNDEHLSSVEEPPVEDDGAPGSVPPPGVFPPSLPLPSTATESKGPRSNHTGNNHHTYTAHSHTPVQNPSAMRRILRKFTERASDRLPTSLSVASSIYSLFFGSSSSSTGVSSDVSLEAFAQLLESLDDDNNDAERSLSAFVHLVLTWAHSRTHLVATGGSGGAGTGMDPTPTSSPPPTTTTQTSSTQQQQQRPRFSKWITPELLTMCIDASQSLVAHGCLDGFQVILPGSGAVEEELSAVAALASAVCLMDLGRTEEMELAALKFLLTVNTRKLTTSSSSETAMLRGTQLLQSLRVCYHVYLRTGSGPNRITARATLQQSVAAVFVRMGVADKVFREAPTTTATTATTTTTTTDPNLSLDASLDPDDLVAPVRRNSTASAGATNTKGIVFESPDHRDAFLVFRSLCKLSIKALPIPYDHMDSSSTSTSSVHSDHYYSDKQQGINPVLESKVLALELLLFLLELEDRKYAALMAASQPFQFAVRQYLCVSLLNNCTSQLARVVGPSLQIFVPLLLHFRSQLRVEIEAFVTNVFFVILDSPHSSTEHKGWVVHLFQTIGSEPGALAEIFLNYDCDLSAVDLFRRIVTALARAARIKSHPTLRLGATTALVKVLASLHASVDDGEGDDEDGVDGEDGRRKSDHNDPTSSAQIRLVEIYDSKQRRKEAEAEVILRFNRSPHKGILYAGECSHLDATDPAAVAAYLLGHGRDPASKLDKTQIGEYLGKEAEYKDGFCLRVLQEYSELMDFSGMDFDDAIRFYLSGFRLPGEAQKIDRIMEAFADVYCRQNPGIFSNSDAAFILSFAIIMLNTDLHNPAIKEERRMTKESFVNMNRGICDGKDLPEELLHNIFGRIQRNPISLKEDDMARAAASGNDPLVDVDPTSEEAIRARADHYRKERDQIVRTTESAFRRGRRRNRQQQQQQQNAGSQQQTPQPLDNESSSRGRTIGFVRAGGRLRDEYVTPMFEVTWGPALAVFSTALETTTSSEEQQHFDDFFHDDSNHIDEDDELTEVCLSGCRLAVATAGMCGNDTARQATVLALYNFSGLGARPRRRWTGRHLLCIRTLLSLGLEDGEILGSAWEHVFLVLSELSRLSQVYEQAGRRWKALSLSSAGSNTTAETEEETENSDGAPSTFDVESDDGDEEEFENENDPLDSEQQVDLYNACTLHEAMPIDLVDSIYHRSASLSPEAAQQFVLQLCRVSRMEVAGYGGHSVGSRANRVTASTDNNFTPTKNRQHLQRRLDGLQKLVEVTHYNLMGRSSKDFVPIWLTVGAHLTGTALHSDPSVAMHAVDSLRQLSVRFLSRNESDIDRDQEQRRFLQPLEPIVSRSDCSAVKELLLNSVERLVLQFGGGSDGPSQGRLRSGWRPLLTVLGSCGGDADDAIAAAGYKLLDQEFQRCSEGGRLNGLGIRSRSSKAVLSTTDDEDDNEDDNNHKNGFLPEHFVNLVDAYTMYVSGRRMDTCLKALDRLVKLSDWLAEGAEANMEMNHENAADQPTQPKTSLELWWPILLGLSRSAGDTRIVVRNRALRTLLDVVRRHFLFFADDDDERKENGAPPRRRAYDLQTVQIIFRGVFIPMLDHAQNDVSSQLIPPLPEDFTHFVTRGHGRRRSSVDGGNHNDVVVVVNDDDATDTDSWVATSLEPLLEGCIDLFLEAAANSPDDSSLQLMEEVMALLNSCIHSDSGAVAVRGLRRLHSLVTGLPVTEEPTWAVVCHMLRRCLHVRGLDADDDDNDNVGNDAVEEKEPEQPHYNNHHFRAEEDHFADRRYMGGNAAAVIGSLLADPEHSASMGPRWYLFLITGLGRGIVEWDRAADLLGWTEGATDTAATHTPPHYSENALYGRKWLTPLLLDLARPDSAIYRGCADDPELDQARRNILEEQTKSTLSAYVEKENDLIEFSSSSKGSDASAILEEARRAAEVGHLTNLVCELLEGLDKLENADLWVLGPWLCPVLSALIQANNRAVRVAVHTLVTRFFQAGTVPAAIAS